MDRFILGMPSLVNKSKRSIFAVVKERQQLADALARYLGQLGLERRPRPALSLRERLEQRAAERASQASSVAPAAEGTTEEASS